MVGKGSVSVRMEPLSRANANRQSIVAPPMNRSARWRRIRIYSLLAISDFVAIIIAFAGASYWMFGELSGQSTMTLILTVCGIYFVFATFTEAYGHIVIEHVSKSFNRAFNALFATLGTILLTGFLIEGDMVWHWDHLLIAFGFSFLTIAVSRWFFVISVCRRKKDMLFDKIILIDDIEVQAPSGFRAIFVNKQGLYPDSNDPMMRHWAALYLQHADRVIVACSAERYGIWANFLKGSNVGVELLMPELDEFCAYSISRYDGNTTVGISNGFLDSKNRLLKRVFDLAVTVFLLIPSLPIMLLCAAAIKLEDGGPVLFRQPRMGRGNKLFELYKFRSMKMGATDLIGGKSVKKSDNRLTKIGRFLRAISIDELPQLLNILRGDMSLVGPRPHALGSLAENKLFWEVEDQYWHRHAIKPGITGLAQVRGYRGSTVCQVDITNRVRSDLEYLQDWSIWRDVSILLATLSVLIHKNAY